MKKTIFPVILVLPFLFLLIASCKKDKLPEVYFTTSSATVNRGDSKTTVTIEFSESTKAIVELDLQSIGADPIRFGSYDMVFLHDDSEKCAVTIDNHAFTDTSGHLKISYGVKSVAVTFTPQYDNFPHAAADFKVKITTAKNATIRQGSDVFSYHINEAPAVTTFTSALAYNGMEHTRWFYNDTTSIDSVVSLGGIFELHNYEFRKNNLGTYDLTLHYDYALGGTHVRTLDCYYTFSALAAGTNHLSCSNSSSSVHLNAIDLSGIGAFSSTSDCTSFTTSTAQLQVTKGASPVYGAFYTFTGNVHMGTSDFTISGDLGSDFLLFD